MHYCVRFGVDYRLILKKTENTTIAVAEDQARRNLDEFIQESMKAHTIIAAIVVAITLMSSALGDKYSDLAAKGYRWAIADGLYAWVSKDDVRQLPHGVIGLLVAAFFAAALSSKASELNALGSCTTVDFYRQIIKRDATDTHCVIVSKWFSAFWGLVAIGFALYAHLVENLIQAVNILGSIFYGVMLGLFVVAFFIRRVGGTAVFWSALVSQALIFFLYFNLTISYLWYPLIGCAACVLLSILLQTFLKRGAQLTRARYETSDYLFRPATLRIVPEAVFVF